MMRRDPLQREKVLHLIQDLGLDLTQAEDVALEEVRDLAQPPRGVDAGGHGEDLVELLQGPAFRLGHQHQDQPPADDVPRAVPREAALRGERVLQRRPRDGQQEVEEPRRGRRERHAVRPHVQRVRLGRVGERHGALAGGVEDAEEEDAQRDAAQARRVVRLRDPEAEAREEHRQRHQRERRQQEIAPAEGVDRVDGRDREEPVDQAEAQRRSERGDRREVGLQEDLGRVVRDHVDSAEL